MNRLLVVAIAVALVAIALPAAVAANGVVFDKTMSLSEAYLGDVTDVVITANTTSMITPPAIVTDIMPPELTMVPGSMQVTGGDYTYSSTKMADNSVKHEWALSAQAMYTIEYQAQVTSVEAWEAGYKDVANAASLSYDGAIQGDDSVTLTLYAYEGLEKDFTLVYEQWEDGVISVNELVAGNLTVTIPNNFAFDITDMLLKDNLGAEWGMAGDDVDNDRDKPTMKDEGDWGDLDAAYNMLPGNLRDEVMDLVIETKGKTNKVQFKVTGIDIDAGGEVECTFGVFTDYNPGKGKPDGIHCYSTAGEDYELNSGATIKVLDPNTGLQLSATTGPVLIDVAEL